jgi:Flp pilus assembly protein TadD
MGAHAVADDRDTCAGASGEIAIDACTRAIDSGVSSGTDLSWRFHNRGRAYEAKGDHARAIADFSEAIRLAPKLAFAFNARGTAYEATGDHDRAIADFNAAISLDPTLAYAFNGRGFAYKAKGDHDRAIADFNAAISLDPKLAFAFYGRGLAYEAKGDHDRAVADHSEAIGLDPGYSAAFTNRGLAYEARGDRERARADFAVAVAIPPKYDDGRWAQATARDRLGALAAATVGAPVPASVQVGSAPTPRPTTAERRVALVIGNAAYPGAGLANPLNDADDVTAALRRVGFDVVEGKDLALDGFSQIVESFRSKAEGADVALLYYAGHGMQFEDQNWLMPVDTRAGSAFDVRHYNVALQDLISDIETHARTTLVFVDACRKNPLDEALKARLRLQGRAYGEARGLARVEIKSPETLVVFATRPNMTAADGDHRNSPFTEAFLKHLPTPGVEVEVLMKRVTRSVEEMTNHKQQPERLSRLEQEFYFVPAK